MSHVFRESSKFNKNKRKVMNHTQNRVIKQRKLQLSPLLYKLLIIRVILPKYLISKNEISLELDMQIKRSKKTPSECVK